MITTERERGGVWGREKHRVGLYPDMIAFHMGENVEQTCLEEKYS